MSGTANAAAFGAVQSPSISPPANVVDDLIQAVAQRACDAANSTLQPLHSASAISEIALGPRIANPISETSIKVADRPSLFRRATRRTLRFAFVLFLGVAFTLAWQSYGETAKHMVVTWAPQLGPWISLHESAGPSIQPHAAGVPSAMPVQEASSQEATAVPDAVRQSTPPTPTSSEASLQQLEEIAQDVTTARQSIERLAAAQAEMASAIAKLQAAQLQTDQKLAAPAPRPNAARVAKPAAPAVPRISSQNQPPFQGVLDPVH
jgi:hypothetical protein